MVENGLTPEHVQYALQALGIMAVAMAFSEHQRKAIFKRARGKCENGVVVGDEPCDRTFYDYWMMHCHHIRPRHMGGRDDTSNGTLLCVEHHALAHLELFEEHGKREDEVAFRTLAETDIHTIHYKEERKRERIRPINIEDLEDQV